MTEPLAGQAAAAPVPPLARALAARGIHYGWVMVALTFVYAVFSSSAMGVPSVLIVPMSEEENTEYRNATATMAHP